MRLLQTGVGLRNSYTRLPFRYGSACLTACPQAIVWAEIELNGVRSVGYAADCLPPGWFDKSPHKSYRQQIDEMLQSIELGRSLYAERFGVASDFFPGWFDIQTEAHAAEIARDWPGLLTGFGISLVERAMLDAAARCLRMSFAELVRSDWLQVGAGQVHPELAGRRPVDWLPETPRREIFVRHTVGLIDPLTAADLTPGERLNDGRPQTLEDYLQQSGLRYFKIKVANDLARDLSRLETLAALVERYCGADYALTLDGNEQYRETQDLERLIDAIRSRPELEQLWERTLLIEQPMPRDVALSPDRSAAIQSLCEQKPIIIDESDEDLSAYRRAIDAGYRGISSKNCKGPLRSILNYGLTQWLNSSLGLPAYLMTGEDLCCVGTVSVQADLCLVATLGLRHVERNGHHYHPGLSYLTKEQQRQALESHPDFYHQVGDVVEPHVRDGKFQIGSLQCEGSGFAVVPDLSNWQTPAQWQFESLGLSE